MGEVKYSDVIRSTSFSQKEILHNIMLLHNNGENAQLFPLIKKGFQIWTAENLQSIGFSAENAPYYAVLRFDANTPIQYDQAINLKQRAYTNVAKIRPLRDFIGI